MTNQFFGFASMKNAAPILIIQSTETFRKGDDIMASDQADKVTVFKSWDDCACRFFYSWEKPDIGGYYDLNAMLRLKNLKPGDIILIDISNKKGG
jgi:hypothetical protein